MSAATVFTPQRTKQAMLGFFNKFSFNKLVTTKEPTKDEEWLKHFKDYQKLVQNLSLFSLKGEVVFSSKEDTLNLSALASSSRIHNPEVAYLTCMDEGVQYISVSKKVLPIAIPGCGVLMTEQQQDLRDKLVKTLKGLGIKKLVVDSHARCGAARIAANTEFANLSCLHSKAFMEKLSELVADDYAHLLADTLHQDFADLEVTSKYITKLDRPNFHNAMGVLVNFEPTLNSSLLIQKLKVPLFALSAFVLDNDVLAEDDILAYNIATGINGYQEKFSGENPFLIIFTIKNEEQRSQALKMISKIDPESSIKYSFIQI